jgi:hypothetical protein
MEATGIGTAVMLAIAAGLWFLYLVPTWLKRREYLATERTAARLQQTIRVMAEASEAPEIVRVEATVRDAARHQSALRAQERADRRALAAQLRREEAAERAADRAAGRAARAANAPLRAIDTAAARRRRIRRVRALASLLMIGATIAGGIQLVLMATTGIVAASWVVLALAATGGCVAVGVQRRLDAVAAPRAVVAPVARAAAPRPAAAQTAAAPAEPARAWTPVPLPKPRYLAQPAPQPVAPRVDAAALLRAAAEEAERAHRAALAEPEVVPFRPRATPAPAAATSAPSRFARMGLVDPTDTSAPDIDAAMRRRTAAG